MIYLASPYSHPDSVIRQSRFESACEVTALLLKQGLVVYSPIVHGHPLTDYGLPGDWSFWKIHAQTFLQRCDALVVLMLEGWQNSIGVQAEMTMAKEWSKPTYTLNPPVGSEARDMALCCELIAKLTKEASNEKEARGGPPVAL